MEVKERVEAEWHIRKVKVERETPTKKDERKESGDSCQLYNPKKREMNCYHGSALPGSAVICFSLTEKIT